MPYGNPASSAMTGPGNIDLPQPLKSILRDTAWEEMQSATGGSAAFVPELLSDLFSQNRQDVIDAADGLWNLLCHQHAHLSVAAIPAAPIIFYALERHTDPQILEMLLLVFLGLAELCDASTWDNPPEYLESLRLILEKNRPILTVLSSHGHEDVYETAEIVLQKLDAAA